MPFSVDRITAPAIWASALVNNDRSGLTESEAIALDSWLETLPAGFAIVDVARNSEGEAEESRFSWNCRAYGLPWSGGDLLDYVIHIHGNKESE